ncbi:hypothetical protein [Ramlibacter sp. Leaf400]|nr:hypothetical protein [Ramlibacter sp. Leaf400]
MAYRQISAQLKSCVQPSRAGLMASPAFWLAVIACVAFWIVVGLLLVR